MKEGSPRRITPRRRPHANNRAAGAIPPRRQHPPAGHQPYRRRPPELLEQWRAIRAPGHRPRCDVLQVGTQATSASAARFLKRHRGAHTIPRQGYPGGRRLRVESSRRRVVSAASCCSCCRRIVEVNGYVERGAPDARGGVLQLLRRGVDDGAVEPHSSGIGGVLQRGASASVAWLAESDGVSCGRRLKDAS